MTSLDERKINRFPNAQEGDTYARARSFLDGPYGDELRAALDRLYEAFKGAKLSSPLNACRHCFTEADVNYLMTTRPRLFTHGDMYLVGTKLVTTLGKPSDVAYFVPRLIEALAEGAYIEPEAIAKRFAQIPRIQWTNARRKALKECFELLFAATDGTEDDFGLEHERQRLRNALPVVFEKESEPR